MPGIPAECQGISSQLRPMTPPSTWDKEMILALSTEADAWICLEGVQKWPWKWPWFKRCWCWNDPRVQESPRWWDESHCLWNGLIFIGHWHVGNFYLEPKPGRGLYYFDEEQKRLFEESRDAYQATMIWLYLVGACWCTYIWHAYLPTIFLRYDPQVLTGWVVSTCFKMFQPFPRYSNPPKR